MCYNTDVYIPLVQEGAKFKIMSIYGKETEKWNYKREWIVKIAKFAEMSKLTCLLGKELLLLLYQKIIIETFNGLFAENK